MTEQTSLALLNTTIVAHLANHQSDETLIRQYVNSAIQDGADGEYGEELNTAYSEWGCEIKALEQADDTYHNADTGSDDEEEALQAKEDAEQAVNNAASEVERALSHLLQ